MKIRVIQRKDLDVQKYNLCIAKASKPMLYAFSDYLDIVARNWRVLVSDDYETVMPIAINRKLLGMTQIYQPSLTQQLGVFGRYDRDVVVIKSFLDALSRFYLRINMQMNASNPVPGIQNWIFSRRTNFVLSLNEPYSIIRKGFRKGHKANIKAAQRQNILERGQLAKIEFLRLIGQATNIDILSKLIELFGLEAIWVARLASGEIGALGFFPRLAHFMEGHEHIIYLAGHTTAAGRAAFSGHFLLDAVIRHYAGKGGVFDFEGSELPGVASFFKGFGPDVENYLHGVR